MRICLYRWKLIDKLFVAFISQKFVNIWLAIVFFCVRICDKYLHNIKLCFLYYLIIDYLIHVSFPITIILANINLDATSYYCQSHLFDHNNCQHANQILSLKSILGSIRLGQSTLVECRVHNEDDIINQCMMRMHLCVCVCICICVYVIPFPINVASGSAYPLSKRSNRIIKLALKPTDKNSDISIH